MSTILLEICYRNFYIASVFFFIQGFSYFTQGFQLEFFSGLFVTNFQAVDFNFHNNIMHHAFTCEKLNYQLDTVELLSGVLKPTQYFHDYFSISSDQFYLNNGVTTYQYGLFKNDFIALSTNEAKTWSCLFIIYLNYFYCVQLNEAILSCLVLYTKLKFLAPFIIMHYYSKIKPGLLNAQKFCVFQIMLNFLFLSFIVNQYTILTAIGVFEEFKLEQLDSEVINS